MINKGFAVLWVLVMLISSAGCNSKPKDTEMPTKPLKLKIDMTAKQLYAMNVAYNNFTQPNTQPMGVTFHVYDFPSKDGMAEFNYSGGTLDFKKVAFVQLYEDIKIKNSILESLSINYFLKNANGKITDKQAHEMMMAFFKELQEKGWEKNTTIVDERLSPEDSFKYAIHPEGTKYQLDYTYPLNFKEWMQLDSVQKWRLRYGTEVFMDIDYNRQTDPKTGNRHYLIGIDIRNQEEEIQGYVENEDRKKWAVAFPLIYDELPAGRLWGESKAIKMGLSIQQDYQDYTLPLVKEKTGIDTGKFISIDPYKLTYEEYLEQQKSGKNDLTSQSITKRYRCEAGQKCPKTGYWYTPAHKDMQARYFEEGDVMPDLPNVWGQVIWQMQQDS